MLRDIIVGEFLMSMKALKIPPEGPHLLLLCEAFQLLSDVHFDAFIHIASDPETMLRISR
jgi:hypothetical protein